MRNFEEKKNEGGNHAATASCFKTSSSERFSSVNASPERLRGWDHGTTPSIKSRRDDRIMHSFSSCLIHCVFSTHERRPWLTPTIQKRLWPYLGGIARENEITALAVGGVADHVHALLSLLATLSISKAVQLLKGNSSKWLRETFPELRAQGFAWQEGFGAFSIGVSGVEETVRYIQGQEEHHKKKSFREELEIFLKKHGCHYEPEMLD